jgi:hypothetical protein
MGSLVSQDVLVRVGAFVAALLVLSAPSLVARLKAVPWGAFVRFRPRGGGGHMDDAHAILEIAGRLKQAGNAEGVNLCEQLLATMLRPVEPAK